MKRLLVALLMTAAAAQAQDEFPEIRYGRAVTAAWNSDALYIFEGEVGHKVTVKLKSSRLRPIVGIYRLSDGTRMAQSHGRDEATAVTVLPADDLYAIAVASLNSGNTGSYTLSLSAEEAPPVADLVPRTIHWLNSTDNTPRELSKSGDGSWTELYPQSGFRDPFIEAGAAVAYGFDGLVLRKRNAPDVEVFVPVLKPGQKGYLLWRQNGGDWALIANVALVENSDVARQAP